MHQEAPPPIPSMQFPLANQTIARMKTCNAIHGSSSLVFLLLVGVSSHPMSPWNDDALASLKEKLKLNVILDTGLIDKLEKAAGGFMNREEVQMVRSQLSNSKQMDKVIEILRGKEDDDFFCFCKNLRDSNNKTWAKELERNAAEFKRGIGKNVCVEYCRNHSERYRNVTTLSCQIYIYINHSYNGALYCMYLLGFV